MTSVGRERDHTYSVTVTWTGNTGAGTAGYRAYGRKHEVTVHGKPSIPGSSDPAFRGDREAGRRQQRGPDRPRYVARHDCAPAPVPIGPR